jgi:hypothetical protein
MRIVALALGAFAYCLLSPVLPEVAVGVDGSVGTVVVFAVVLAVSQLSDELPAAILVGLGAGMTAAVLTAAHQDVAATVPEAVTCACIGALFARGMELPALVLAVPLVVAVIDAVSVGSGGVPFSFGGTSGDILSLDIPAWGGGTAIRVGIADPIFAAVFFTWARRFDLRVPATAAAMLVAAFAAVVLTVSADITVPALPLLAAAFYLPNLDRLGRLARDRQDVIGS